MEKGLTLEFGETGIVITLGGEEIGNVTPVSQGGNPRFCVRIYWEHMVNYVDGRNTCVTGEGQLKETVLHMIGLRKPSRNVHVLVCNYDGHETGQSSMRGLGVFTDRDSAYKAQNAHLGYAEHRDVCGPYAETSILQTVLVD